jgi:hypothetical protein
MSSLEIEMISLEIEKCHRQNTLTAIERILTAIAENLRYPKLISQFWIESQQKTRGWAKCIAAAHDLKFESPETLEALRSRYSTTSLVARWLNQMHGEIDAARPFRLFNFDEAMVSAEPHHDVVAA